MIVITSHTVVGKINDITRQNVESSDDITISDY